MAKKIFTLTIECENDAFTPDPFPEIARILRDVAAKVAQGIEPGTLMDVNGNKVGEAEGNL